MLASVYIRKDDEDKWRALPKKTETIHKLLNEQTTDTVFLVDKSKVSTPESSIRPLKIPKDEYPTFFKKNKK